MHLQPSCTPAALFLRHKHKRNNMSRIEKDKISSAYRDSGKGMVAFFVLLRNDNAITNKSLKIWMQQRFGK